jgi:carboxypeptidase Q
MKKIGSLLVLACFSTFAFAQDETIDASAIQKIREEGMKNSKVMDIAFHLTDANGPRLTGSAGFLRAAQYAKDQLTKWGLKNVTIEPWGEFGKGWELQKSYVALTAPYYKPIIGVPKTWTAGSNGLRNGEVILISAKDSAGLDAYRGKLKNKVIIFDRTDVYKHSFKADAARYTEDELNKMATAVAQPANRPGGNANDTAAQRRRQQQMDALRATQSLNSTLRQLAIQEGAVALLSVNPRGHDGTVFVQGGGAYKATDPENFLDVVVAWEDYMPILRMIKSGMPVKMDVDVKTAFQTKDTQGYNVIAEIPGTDPVLKNEIVMLGGHLDSWHGATGATDNAAGCSVMMEAVRIIKSIGANPKRTIRIALWSGEEQGLLGSRAYVKKTFADPATMQLLPSHEKLSAYYNLDNGTGKIRGIYLQGNEGARPIFTKWLEPFNDLGAKTVTINNTGGTDHQAFDAVGLPGFQFIQDEIEYDTRTHHTNMDSYDHLIEEDLKQASTVVAAFVYNTAQRSAKIPRKELPQPRGNQQR